MSLLMDALKQQQQVPVAAAKTASGHGWRIAALTLLVVLGLVLGFFIPSLLTCALQSRTMCH